MKKIWLLTITLTSFIAKAGLIKLENQSDFDLIVNMYCDSCRIHDEGAFQAVSCKEIVLRDKEKHVFQTEQVCVLIMQYSNFGLNYSCKNSVTQELVTPLEPSYTHEIKILPSYYFFPTTSIECEINRKTNCVRH